MRTTSQLLLTFLLNACWQIALVASVASAGNWLLRKTAARYRHLLWVAAMLFSIVLPVFSCASLLRGASASPAQPSPIAAPAVPVAGPQRFAALTPTPPSLAATEPASATHQTPSAIQVNRILAAAVVALYLLFLLYRSGKLFRAWGRTRRIKLSARSIDLPANLRVIIERCQNAIGPIRVDLLCSTSVPVPITVGVRKPLVILPEQLLREGDDDVLTSAVGHELVHVWRRDYLLNLLYEIIYLPLSFHPAAALVRRRINQTRELGCDEQVTEKLLGAEIYARSLVRLAGSAVPFGRPATLTLGITDADILEVRIMSLLKKPKPNMRRKNLLLIASSLLLAVPCVAAASFGIQLDIKAPGLARATAIAASQPTAREARMRLRAEPAPTNADVNPLNQEQQDQQSEARKREEQEQRERAEHTIVELKEKLARETNPDVRAKLEAALKRATEAWEGKTRGYLYLNLIPGSEERRETERAVEALHEQLSRENNPEARAKLEGALKKKLAALEESKSRGYAVTVQAGDGWQAERELEAKRKMALASAAKITMDQAIQIATSQHAGKVLECSLIGEHWEAPGQLSKDSQVLYHVVILSGDEANLVTTHVLVNALDGTVLKAATEDGSRKGNLELRRKPNAQPR